MDIKKKKKLNCLFVFGFQIEKKKLLFFPWQNLMILLLILQYHHLKKIVYSGVKFLQHNILFDIHFGKVFPYQLLSDKYHLIHQRSKIRNNHFYLIYLNYLVILNQIMF